MFLKNSAKSLLLTTQKQEKGCTEKVSKAMRFALKGEIVILFLERMKKFVSLTSRNAHLLTRKTEDKVWKTGTRISKTSFAAENCNTKADLGFNN
jgi:hypothetical protein